MKIKSYDIKLKEYEQYLSSLPFICTEKIESEKTVFVMVDIINGFIREGVPVSYTHLTLPTILLV